MDVLFWKKNIHFNNDEERLQYNAMEIYCNDYSDEPDGVFFGLAEEMYGWDHEDWAWFASLNN